MYRAQDVCWAFVGGIISGTAITRVLAGTFHRDAIANTVMLVVGAVMFVIAIMGARRG